MLAFIKFEFNLKLQWSVLKLDQDKVFYSLEMLKLYNE